MRCLICVFVESGRIKMLCLIWVYKLFQLRTISYLKVYYHRHLESKVIFSVMLFEVDIYIFLLVMNFFVAAASPLMFKKRDTI